MGCPTPKAQPNEEEKTSRLVCIRYCPYTNNNYVHLPPEDTALTTVSKQLEKSKKANSKKDQEIALLRAQLEDREDQQRARFPNGPPLNSDIESEDDIRGNAADLVNTLLPFIRLTQSYILMLL